MTKVIFPPLVEAGRLERQDAAADRQRDRFRPRCRAELAEDCADVELDGVLADAQFAGNPFVWQAGGHMPQDLDLPVGEVRAFEQEWSL